MVRVALRPECHFNLELGPLGHSHTGRVGAGQENWTHFQLWWLCSGYVMEAREQENSTSSKKDLAMLQEDWQEMRVSRSGRVASARSRWKKSRRRMLRQQREDLGLSKFVVALFA